MMPLPAVCSQVFLRISGANLLAGLAASFDMFPLTPAVFWVVLQPFHQACFCPVAL